MAIIYIATDAQVPCEQTAALLKDFQAIWCPPPRLRPWNGTPSSARETVVLVHRAMGYTLLVTGTVCQNTRLVFGTDLLWTNRDLPGVRQKAEGLGYSGPRNMTFLRLEGVRAARQGVTGNAGKFLDGLKPGLNTVTEHEVEGLIQTMEPPQHGGSRCG